MINDVSVLTQLLPYNLILLIGYIWFFFRYRKSRLLLLIVTLLFAGLFLDFGVILFNTLIFGSVRQLALGRVVYELGVLLWTIVVFRRYSNSIISQKHKFLIISFVAYLVWMFIVSIAIHGDSTLLFVRETSKDIIPFLMFLVLTNIMQEPTNKRIINLLFFRLIFAQIIFGVAKLIIFMNFHEGLVGSLTGLTHGGPGTTFPLLGLIFVAINSKMLIKAKEIWMIVGLLLIGFLAGKRAVWLLFPVMYFLLSVYVYRQKFFHKIILTVVIGLAVGYFGLRLIPAFNPENVIWGSFDPEYAYNYGREYSMGEAAGSERIEKGRGRVGALALTIDLIANARVSEQKIMFGYGLKYFSAEQTLDRYYDSDYWWGIQGRGSITGVLYKFFSTGLIAAILYVVYLLLLLSNVKNKRLRNVITIMVFFDFIFYNASILTFPSLFVLLIFAMLYDNPRKNYYELREYFPKQNTK